ncbi:hypothetical protein JG688_00011649 [Phytophthora aleatoria]|uniref:Uncharacterized protein n=1 Tax=Phytophthora aleatoria TaxID=2496075 RepID=A0A8J5J429_9STRA|nr:hypothetical protein JG688_00011649 [Phytophthora aleatoria]
MIPRSYEGDGDGKWLLFAREEDTDALVFTAVVTQETNVVAQLQVDADALKDHSEELGLEMESHAFKTLLLVRCFLAVSEDKCIQMTVSLITESTGAAFVCGRGDRDGERHGEGDFPLAYVQIQPLDLSKGSFQLPIVAKDAPQSLVELLDSIHAKPPQPMLSEQQKSEKQKKNIVPAASAGVMDQDTSTINSQETKNIDTASQSSDNGTTAAVNPMLLKRRHMPTGTMRRRGPKGAKLVKK